MIETTTKRCGLRFERSEAGKLQSLADRAKARDLKADVSLFVDAAEATRMGDALVVIFEDIEEVVTMVAAFVRFGIKQPAIEELRAPGG